MAPEVLVDELIVVHVHGENPALFEPAEQHRVCQLLRHLQQHIYIGEMHIDY